MGALMKTMIKRMTRACRFRSLAAVLLVLIPSIARGQTTPCDAAKAPLSGMPPMASLSLAYSAECLGGTADTDPLTKALAKTLPKDYGKNSRAEARILVLATLDPLFKAVAAGQIKSAGDPTRSRVFTGLADALTAARGAVDALLLATSAEALLTSHWAWDTNQERFGAIDVPIKALVDGACGSPGPSCTLAYTDAAQAMRVARLV